MNGNGWGIRSGVNALRAGCAFHAMSTEGSLRRKVAMRVGSRIWAAGLLILAFSGDLSAQSFDWVSTVQASGRNAGSWVVSDNAGNVFSSAFATSGFVVDPGGALCCFGWENGPYVYKLTENRQFAWTGLIAAQSISAGGVATDASGNVYMAGFTGSSFASAVPGTGAALSPPYGPGAVIWKMNADGASVWIRQLATPSATSYALLRGLAVRSDGSVIVAGHFKQSIDLDPGPGVVTLTSRGQSDLFVVALDAQGDYVWGRQFGGVNEETVSSMAVGPAGDVLLVGQFSETFPLPTDSGQLISAGGKDGLVLHLDANGDFLWAGSIGGPGDDRVSDAAFDPAGNILLAGSFSDQADLDPGSSVALVNSEGLADGFVEMLDASHSLIWKRQLGGVGEDRSQAVAFGSGSLYVGGTFTGTVNFGAPGGSVTALGADDGYVLKLGRDGSFQNVFAIGGASIITNNDPVTDLFVDRSGALLVTGGYTKTVDFDPDPDATYTVVNSSEWSDAYTLRLNDQGAVRLQADFDPAIVSVGADTRLTLSLSSSLTTTDLDAVSLNQALPDGWRISPDAGPTSTCGGSVVAVPGGAAFALMGGALAVGETCQVGINVRSATAGSFSIVTTPDVFGASQEIWPLSTTTAPVVVERAGSILLVDSIEPSPSMPGESVEFSAHVSVPWSEMLEATGEITASNGTQACTIVLPDSTCSMVFTALGSNEVTFSYLGDTNFLPSSATQTQDVYAFTDLSVTVENHPSRVHEGSDFDFNLVVHNAGPFAATDALLTIASTGYTILGWQCVEGCVGSGSQNSFEPLSIEANAEIVLHVDAHVASNIDEIVTVANISVSKPFHDAIPANNTATQSAAVVIFFDSFDL